MSASSISSARLPRRAATPRVTGLVTGLVTSLLTGLVACLVGCGDYRVIDVPSANQNSRVNHLVIHFTSENHSESLRLLTEPSDAPVSAHYLIPDPRDPLYGRPDVVVHRLVPESRRAWHAGSSVWAGENTLNNRSIGIEIVNESRCETPAGMNAVRVPSERVCTFLPYEDAQIETLIELTRDILARHPDIDPVDVVGHADITPMRRVDPGPLFPWERLHAAGIGAWPDPERVERNLGRIEGPWAEAYFDLAFQQRALATLGYEVESSGILDAQTRFALQAFQMHFRPADHSGVPDAESFARLLALIEEYRPDEFSELALPEAP